MPTSYVNTNIGTRKEQLDADIESALLNHSHPIVTSTTNNVKVATTPGVAGYLDTQYITVFSINGRALYKAATATANILTGSIKRYGVRVNAGGAGYAIGDILNLTTTGAQATVIATEVVQGVIQEVKLVASGYSYTSGLSSATTVSFSPTGVSGTGCTILITDVDSYSTCPISTFTPFLITLAQNGTIVGTQGASTVASPYLGVTSLIVPTPVLPDCPLWQAPIGVIVVATDATHTFLVGAAGSYSGQAGITMTYYDLCSMAQSAWAI